MISAIIVAGGKGERLSSELPKQFLDLGGKPVLLRSIECIWSCTRISEMIVVVPEAFISKAREILAGKEVLIVAGGAERQDSVFAGLQACSIKAELIAIHDGVRPFAGKEMFERVIAAAEKYGAAIPGLPVKETIKEVESKTRKVIGTVDRTRLFAIQTPQVFKRSLIMEAHNRAQNLGFYATDDAGLVEWLGQEVVLVPGEEDNIKITTPFDFKLAENILQEMKK
jgi:2-C-methyl-D-erythritol 4-phosphate cytidylyltransferase